MRGILKRSVLLILALTLVVGSTYAYIPDNEGKSEVELLKGVEYWKQGYVPFTGEDTITGESGSSSIRAAACSHFSMAYALVKMGILNPENGDSPLSQIVKSRENSAFRVGWGYYEFAKAPIMYPGVKYIGVDYNVSGLSGEEGLTYVKGLMNQGYYVIGIVSTPETNGHCIFFDGINEDGTTSIGDSWFDGTTWENYYGKTDTVWSYLELLKNDTKEFGKQPSIYSSNSLNGEVSKEDVEKYNKLVKEKDLKGMPVKTDLASYARLPSYKSLDSLKQHEKDSVVSIKESHDANKLFLGNIVNACSTLIGILLVVYGVSIVLCFILNCVNSFVDLDFVSLITFGHIKVVMDRKDYEGNFKKGYVTIAKLFIIVLVVISIGVLLINGTIMRMLYYLVGLFS